MILPDYNKLYPIMKQKWDYDKFDCTLGQCSNMIAALNSDRDTVLRPCYGCEVLVADD